MPQYCYVCCLYHYSHPMRLHQYEFDFSPPTLLKIRSVVQYTQLDRYNLQSYFITYMDTWVRMQEINLRNSQKTYISANFDPTRFLTQVPPLVQKAFEFGQYSVAGFLHIAPAKLLTRSATLQSQTQSTSCVLKLFTLVHVPPWRQTCVPWTWWHFSNSSVFSEHVIPVYPNGHTQSSFKVPSTGDVLPFDWKGYNAQNPPLLHCKVHNSLESESVMCFSLKLDFMKTTLTTTNAGRVNVFSHQRGKIMYEHGMREMQDPRWRPWKEREEKWNENAVPRLKFFKFMSIAKLINEKKWEEKKD